MRMVLISDLDGIWIKTNHKIFDEINKKLTGKVIENKELSKLKRLARIGRMSSFKMGYIIYQKNGFKNFIELRVNFRKLEIKNAKRIYKIVHGAKETLRKLKRKNIRIFILTDSPNESCYLKIILDKIGLLRYFDEVFTSHDLGMEKPSAFKCFTFLNDSYKVYFLGHDDDEIIGAKKFGFLTIGLKNKNADIYISKIEELSNIL
ncbi:MAG: HAD family hydrolase [Candidatus Aenigmatarchaeota archaeon]